MSSIPTMSFKSETLAIKPWYDENADADGHDPRSDYVETYWLSVLGPSTTWLLRYIAKRLDTTPDGFELDLGEAARCLGLASKGNRGSAFTRALSRLVYFDLASAQGGDTLAVRLKVPPLSRRLCSQLPDALQVQHEHCEQQSYTNPEVEKMRHRSRQLALSLLEMGENQEGAIRQLLRWKFHPAMAQEATDWARSHHGDGLAKAAEG